MSRLPSIGGDNGQWGLILNDYLAVAHAADGTFIDASIAKAKLATGVQTSLGKADTALQAADIVSKANDSEVVKLTGTQTIAGVKTFSSAPTVPDGSFSIDKTTGLTAALAGKASTATATTTAAGIVELATDPETATGTDAARAVTPAGITAYVAANGISHHTILATGASVPGGTPAGFIVRLDP